MATSGLDLNAYFAAKRAAVTPDKLTALADASESKTAALLQRRLEAEQTRNQIAAQEAASANSWAGRLGLEPESFMSNRVNDVASVVSGASRLVGHVASLPVNAAAMASTSELEESEYAAYNRNKISTPLEGDADILGRLTNNGLTVKEKFDNANVQRSNARGVNDFFNLTKIVDQTNRNNLNKDLGDSFDANWGKVTSGNVMDTVTGLGGLALNTGEALVTNPSAVREYVLENAPQLLVGALGKAGKVAMAASNVGYGADTYQQGIEAYAKKNGGQLPPEEERQRMALQAVALSALEQTGDVAGLALGGLTKKAAAEAVKTSFKESLKNVTKAGSGAFATEALTEAGQTYLEGEITGKPATAKEMYTAGAIGGASGASLSGGLRTLAEVSGATAEQAAVRQQTVIDKEVLEAAADKGDVTTYMDKTSPNYSPGKAVEVLFKHSQKEDTTPEQREANTAKADEIVAGLAAERETVSKQLALATIAGTEKAIAEYSTSIASMAENDPDLPGMVSAREVYQENLAYLQEKRENPVAVKAYRENLAKLDAQLESTNKSRAALGTLATEQTNVTDWVAQADVDVSASGSEDSQGAPAVEVARLRASSTESANKVITLAMRAPEKVSEAQARQLADNPKNGLSENQRTYLRAFSEERVAEHVLKTMDKVAVEITSGGKRYIGMAQHRAALSAALAAGNQEVADKVIKTLSRFSASHSGKAAAVSVANNGEQVLKDQATGEWFVATPAQRITSKNNDLIANRKEVDDLVRKNGGFTKNSDEMVLTIQDEAAALKKMVATANAAYALKFDVTKPTTPTTTTGADNVPNTPQRVPAQDGQSQAKAAETTKAVESAGSQGTVVPEVGKPSGVETAGVKEASVPKEAPASSVVTETAKETKSVDVTEETTVPQSTEKTEVNSTSDEETEFESEDRLKKEADAVEAARTAKVTDLGRRIALLEKLKTCMGG